ncbi:MAG: hypothetical protein STSR0007_08610 [Thermovirga sp.]
MKFNLRKTGLIVGGVAVVFFLGFAGGLVVSKMMANEGPETSRIQQPRAYPIYDLGEFKLSLAGGKYTDARLVSFELVLELQDQKFLEELNGDEYWRALFRNEVISEAMGQGVDAFQNPEGFLKLSEAFTRRLNGVTPEVAGGTMPIRRILFKSMIIQ